METRLVRPSEYDLLGRLTVEAFESLPGAGDLGSYAATLADVAHRASAVDVAVVVAVDAGVVVGGVTYVADWRAAYAASLEPGEVGIRMLAVAPEAQGRGAGRALAVACIQRALQQRARRIALHSTPVMTAAHQLYLSLGFRRAPERDERVSTDMVLQSFVLDIAGDDLDRAGSLGPPARVAESADAGGLNPPGPQGPCGFEPRPGHAGAGRGRSCSSHLRRSGPYQPTT